MKTKDKLNLLEVLIEEAIKNKNLPEMKKLIDKYESLFKEYEKEVKNG